MKNISFTFLLLILGTISFAQQGFQDVLYLKNGSIIRGTIVEQVPNVDVKMKSADGSIMSYKIEEIERMVKEIVVTDDHTKKISSGLKPGYLGVIDIGYGFGVGKYAKGVDFAKLDIINGYQFNPYVSLGIGTGFKYYFEDNNNSFVIPVYADLRAHFLDYMISPYVAIGIGYSIELDPDLKEVVQKLGFMFNPSFGASFKIAKGSALNLGLGFLTQRTPGGKALNSIHLDFGISF